MSAHHTDACNGVRIRVRKANRTFLVNHLQQKKLRALATSERALENDTGGGIGCTLHGDARMHSKSPQVS